MTKIMYKIPLSTWVQKTIERMNSIRATDKKTWNKFWLETYCELGGESGNTGKKPCPKAAAYGLWRLGWVKLRKVEKSNLSIAEINKIYGKNAAYAILTIELLANGDKSYTQESLTELVRNKYKEHFNESVTLSNIEAIKVGKLLYDEGNII